MRLLSSNGLVGEWHFVNDSWLKKPVRPASVAWLATIRRYAHKPTGCMQSTSDAPDEIMKYSACADSKDKRPAAAGSQYHCNKWLVSKIEVLQCWWRLFEWRSQYCTLAYLPSSVCPYLTCLFYVFTVATFIKTPARPIGLLCVSVWLWLYGIYVIDLEKTVKGKKLIFKWVVARCRFQRLKSIRHVPRCRLFLATNSVCPTHARFVAIR